MQEWLKDAVRRATQLHLPIYGQWAVWVTLFVASYTQALVAHAMFVGVTAEGVVMTPTAADHLYPTSIALVGAQRHHYVSLLSLLPFSVLHNPWLYVVCLAGYFVCATLWSLQVWPRWSPLLTAALYTATMSMFWERSALIAEWWSTVNVVLIILAAWYWFYGHEIARALRSGTFWKTALFPAWVHGLCVFALAWFFSQAGWRKLLLSGWDWTDGTTLQLSVHWARFKFGPTAFSTIQDLVLQNHTFAGVLNTASVVLESTALLCLLPMLFPRLAPIRWVYGFALTGFFFGVTVLFGTWYFESLFAMVAVVLWPFDRWLPRVAAALARREKVRLSIAETPWGRVKRALIHRFDVGRSLRARLSGGGHRWLRPQVGQRARRAGALCREKLQDYQKSGRPMSSAPRRGLPGMAFTERGLARWREVLQRHDELPGLVAAVRQGEHAHVVALGETRRETVFRISSMTKPVTAVATLMMVEECRLRLDESIEDWLPELAGRRVLKDMRGPLDGPTVPAQRAITLRDLLTMRMGFGQFLAAPDQTPILRALIDRLNGFGPPEPQKTPGPDEVMKRLGEFPWLAQPGERWLYNTAYDVLGVLIARVSGQPFEQFLSERIFAPLGMNDTGFYATDRLGTHYSGHEVFDSPDGQFSRAPAFFSGAGGLVSTVDDYLAFTRALETDALISRSARELMTTDQLTPEQHARDGLMPNDFAAIGYGFGVAVVTRREGFESLGTYGWDGGMGSSWRSDPHTGLTGVLLTPVNWTQPSPPTVQLDFWASAYAALD